MKQFEYVIISPLLFCTMCHVFTVMDHIETAIYCLTSSPNTIFSISLPFLTALEGRKMF
ncbi:hypothetical protein BJ165DRAFT_1491200 [Panaeolus papilionaceus]|nr:hypothetical protein BJ165DRAFT_1491200 [Panaeolus papilionaceus]